MTMTKRGVAVAVSVVCLLAACSGGDQPADGPETASQTSAALTPADVPAGWSDHTAGPISFALPADWSATAAPSVAKSGADAQGWGFVAPAAEGQSTNGVTVIVSPNPPTHDVHQVVTDGNVTAERTLGAHDTVAQELTWPGAEAAAYSSYLAEVPPGPGDGDVDSVAVRFETLVLTTSGGDQVMVMAYGPIDHESAADVHTLLTTVTVS
jgi:hypothetical protein